MKYHYLTDDSEKSLAPFFSQRVLSADLAGAVIVGAFLTIFWPRQPLADIMATGKEPAVFFLVFAAVLIVQAYINLCCGAGDMVRKGYHMLKYPTDQSTYELQIDFYRYGLIEFLLHGLLLLLPFLPLMALAAFVSVISLTTFLMGVGIIYSASLLCRLSGFMVYLFWGRSSTLGYFSARAMMLFFVFITIIFAPSVNPLYLLYRLNQNAGGSGYPFAFYMTAVTSAILIFILINNALVRRHMNKSQENMT